jgi:DNA-binding MarR family transcriptional regulator
MARQPASTATDLDPAEIAARLRLSATRLARRLRQEADSGFTPSQLSALAAIHNRGPLTLGALAELERVAPPSITKVVSKLEAEGHDLIEESRRRKTTWLTGRIRTLDAGDQVRLAAALDALDALLAAEERP